MTPQLPYMGTYFDFDKVNLRIQTILTIWYTEKKTPIYLMWSQSYYVLINLL